MRQFITKRHLVGGSVVISHHTPAGRPYRRVHVRGTVQILPQMGASGGGAAIPALATKHRVKKGSISGGAITPAASVVTENHTEKKPKVSEHEALLSNVFAAFSKAKRRR